MGHHIDEDGLFRSDKHPELEPDHVVIDLHDPQAWSGLMNIALDHQMEGDRAFGVDLADRLVSIHRERAASRG